MKDRAGLEAAEELHGRVSGATLTSMATSVDDDGLRHYRPWPSSSSCRLAAMSASTTPPFFFWWNHCGYGPIWENADWGASPRPFSEYVDEAAAELGPSDPSPGRPGTPGAHRGRHERLAPHPGRRSRQLLENLWPKLALVVSLDNRINGAGMHADLILPAAHEAERVNLQYPVSHTIELVFSDQAVPPAGEARSDWQIFGELCGAIARRAVDRGMGDRQVGRARPRKLAELAEAFTMGGALASDEAMVDELVRDTAVAGVIAEDASLAKLRRVGWEPIVGNGGFPGGQVVGSTYTPTETFVAHRWRVERGVVYPTLTGRATFYVDHPWFIEAGEELPTHKPAPGTGGPERAFVLTGGHPRWSIHACNATNPVILETTRGHPTLIVNQDQAASMGIADDASVRVCNDLGSFEVAARLSPGVRPGQVDPVRRLGGLRLRGLGRRHPRRGGHGQVAAPGQRLGPPALLAVPVAACVLRPPDPGGRRTGLSELLELRRRP